MDTKSISQTMKEKDVPSLCTLCINKGVNTKLYEALSSVLPFVEYLKGRALGPGDIDSTELFSQVKNALAKAEGK